MSSATPSKSSVQESTTEQPDVIKEFMQIDEIDSSLVGLNNDKASAPEGPIEDIEIIDPPLAIAEVDAGDKPEVSQETDAVETFLTLIDQSTKDLDSKGEATNPEQETIKKNRAPHNKVSVPVQVFQMQDPAKSDTGERQLTFKPKNNSTYIEFPNLLDGFLLVSCVILIICSLIDHFVNILKTCMQLK
jgi:hypothetical protein